MMKEPLCHAQFRHVVSLETFFWYDQIQPFCWWYSQPMVRFYPVNSYGYRLVSGANAMTQVGPILRNGHLSASIGVIIKDYCTEFQ